MKNFTYTERCSQHGAWVFPDGASARAFAEKHATCEQRAVDAERATLRGRYQNHPAKSRKS